MSIIVLIGKLMAVAGQLTPKCRSRLINGIKYLIRRGLQVTFKNRFYPHLLPNDIPVWERFLEAFPDRYDRIDYDVRVGKGREAPPEFEANLRKMALDLSRRRIDAIGYTPNRIDIIEITRLADLKAIGQLLAYPLLYRETFGPSVPVHTILVAEELHTDIKTVLDSLPVEVWLSPDPSGQSGVV